MAASAAAPVILWFRQDLRLADHPALDAALASGQPVIPLYILDETPHPGRDAPARWGLGGAHRWWLHHSLAALGRELAARGAPLVLRRGAAEDVLAELLQETGATAIHMTRPVEPEARSLTDRLARKLAARRVALHRHAGATLFDPEAIRTQTGGVYGVYSPFARACRARPEPPPPHDAPGHIPGGPELRSDRLEDWRLLPDKPDWAGGLRDTWTPGEAGAAARLRHFLDHGLAEYDRGRDLPGGEHTSRLSPHLHWGEIAASRVWHAAAGARSEKFRNEVLWREFSCYLLWHMPQLPEQPLRPNFARMPWRQDPAGLRAWQRGRTGIPIVDAGMRQLWQTGWMHNRIRMVVASFLVKHLLLPWQTGQDWFWDTLVDGDLASNAASWQWVAGCGADAAPYFRVFNPVLQGRKFDAEGEYVRRFVPELTRLPAAHIHAPWQAPEAVLHDAGVALGRDYPHPLLDLAEGRDRALAAYREVTGDAGGDRAA
jgi:deoxyribodipyrimidine photo-lyase